jgi:hypothetical protein
MKVSSSIYRWEAKALCMAIDYNGVLILGVHSVDCKRFAIWAIIGILAVRI